MDDRKKRVITVVVLAIVVLGVAITTMEFSPVDWFMKLHGF